MGDRRGIARFKEIKAFRTDAWRGIKGIKQPERAAAHAAFFFELTAGTAFRRFACFQFAGRDLQQPLAGAMAILADEQDLFILDKQDGRTARMTDEIALKTGACLEEMGYDVLYSRTSDEVSWPQDNAVSWKEASHK